MTDIHSHIVFDVDDGSRSVEESLAILKKLASVGFTNVIMTPHYIEGTEYSAANSEKLEKLDILRTAVSENNIGINLYLGNEIFVKDNIPEDIENGLIYTLNNSKYLLFEIPFHNQILNLLDIVYELKVAGYIPILAHPERYDYLKSNHKYVDTLKEEGLLFQCNYASILGHYGNDAYKTMKYMLKKGYVDYLGTDIHHPNQSFVTDNFDKITKKIIKIAGKEYYQEIMNNCDNLVKEESN